MKFQAPLTIEADTPEEAEFIRKKIVIVLGGVSAEVGELEVPSNNALDVTGGQSATPEKAPKTITVYTDGGCNMKQGAVGAWAYIIRTPDGEEISHSSGEFGTTNNRMEMTALIRALEVIEIGEPIEVFSDSEYLIKGCTSWSKNWIYNGWKTAAGKPVINKDLWEVLITLVSLHNLKFNWVKGHSGDKYNDKCDEMCTKTMHKLLSDAKSQAPSDGPIGVVCEF